MQSLSLIHALVLLNNEECLNGEAESGRLARNVKNMALAEELAFQMLGRNLRELPRETQILFLLIEKMGERDGQMRKNRLSSYQFTKKEIQTETGWSNRVIKDHLEILQNGGFLAMGRKRYKLLFSSRAVVRLSLEFPAK